jgi:hypothetical protein
MSTQTAEARIAATLRRKVRRFYDHLNRHEFEKCYSVLDPGLRESASSVTLYQYVSSLERFLDWYGVVNVLGIDPIQLHLNEPNRQYDNRDFAVVAVSWEDQAGQGHTFRERWVRDRGGKWYTRCTGLVTPDVTP